ncbi:MAG TPA: methyltransferase domain-containing protein [Hyphomicrobiaceae bacterium]|nr:methyltransferase domain-containing protein [Hyphomicrobiaceae bacterium]
MLEEPVTGVRLYEEGGVAQSRVRAGGDSDVAYVRLMSVLLQGSRDVLLLGCGGGSLAGMLHRRGSSVTVVDVNPVSFELARTFFWMPPDVSCVSGDARDFLAAPGRTFDAIGVDVGGPRFSYTAVLNPVAVGDACRALRTGGRIAVNISLEAPDDPVPGRIADRFAAEGLAVWVLSEPPHSNEVNAVIVASRRPERPSDLASLAGEGWSLARLGEGRNRQLTRGGAQRSVEADA